jgi:hypothetical protein
MKHGVFFSAVVAFSVLLATALVAGSAQAGKIPGFECGPPKSGDTPENVVIVLFDISRSTDGAEVRRAYSTDFEKVRYAISEPGGALHGHSTYVAVGAIDADSGGHFNPTVCAFPHVGGNDNPLMAAAKIKSFGKQVSVAAHRIIDGPRQARGTAILDALSSTSNHVTPYGGAKHKYLVIFSDMIEESDRLKMTNAALRSDAVSSFVHKQWLSGNLPKLNGFQVYVAGAGESANKATAVLKRDLIRNFWIQYLHAAKANLDSSNWNGRLSRFP